MGPFAAIAAILLLFATGFPAVEAQDAQITSSVAESADSQNFFRVFAERFGSWDSNHDGSLSVLEVNHAILDPLNTGDAACVLAALHAKQRNAAKDEQDQMFTLGSIAAIEQDPLKAKSYIRSFSRAKKRLRGPKIELFAAGAPHLSAIKQGKTGDCYFICALGALVECRPNEVRSMIEAASDGSYMVRFHDQAPISVSIPTQAEFATYGDSGEDGIWLNVIEKAFAKSKIASMPDADEDMMYDKISGGRPGASIQLLTGHKARRFSFASENTRSVIRSELSNAFADHRLVTTSIKTIKKDGTKGGHALAVLSYEPGFDQVKIWNPWGTSGRYKSVGIKMESGIFTMSVEEWLGRFSSATIEQ